MDANARAAQRALGLVGTRFRLGGRDPAYGLDCVGLVLASHDFAPPPSTPRRAAFGASRNAPWEACLVEAGFVLSDHAEADGDVLLLDCGRGRRHLAIRAGGGFVHAHAGLGFVVVSTSLDDMTVLSRWRRHG